MTALVMVRPRFDGRGLHATALLTGVAVAAGTYLLSHPGHFVSLLTHLAIQSLLPRPVQAFIWIILVLVVSAALGVLFARRCQRLAPVFAVGQVYGSAVVLTYCVARWLQEPTLVGMTAGTYGIVLPSLFVVMAAAFVGSMFGAGNLLMCRFCSRYLFRILEQDGTLCWGCGYIFGHATIATCPECGRSRNNSQNTASPRKSLGARRVLARIGATSIIVLAVTAVLLRTTTPIYPAGNALSKLPNTNTMATLPMFDARISNGLAQVNNAWDSFGAVQNLPGHPQMVLGICYESNPRPGQPTMQLQLLARPTRQGPPAEDGDPIVLCNLDRAQADSVLQFGVPKELAQAMVAAAERAQW